MSDESQGKKQVCQAEESINWKQCIFCQSDDKKKGVLAQRPKLESYRLILQVVQERASLNDGGYVQVQRRLQNCTPESMCTERVVWHRSCHSSATNKVEIQCARDRNAHALAKGHYTAKKLGQRRISTERAEPDPSTSGSPLSFTRSHTNPLDKSECFSCQKDNGQLLYQIRTENAGKDYVKYHTSCWRENVFHALRETTTSKTAKATFLQRSSLLELINLIDVETQNQAYLPMEDIETTYLNLIGSEVKDEANIMNTISKEQEPGEKCHEVI